MERPLTAADLDVLYLHTSECNGVDCAGMLQQSCHPGAGWIVTYQHGTLAFRCAACQRFTAEILVAETYGS